MRFQIALAFTRAKPGRLFLKPPSGGFPEGLLDRAFYARVCVATDLKARFNGLELRL
jgi:hypothetical protein